MTLLPAACPERDRPPAAVQAWLRFRQRVKEAGNVRLHGVRGHPVHGLGSAPGAPVHDLRSLAAVARQTNGRHQVTARTLPVAWGVVDVEGVEAERAVVAVAAVGDRKDGGGAVLAGETGVFCLLGHGEPIPLHESHRCDCVTFSHHGRFCITEYPLIPSRDSGQALAFYHKGRRDQRAFASCILLSWARRDGLKVPASRRSVVKGGLAAVQGDGLTGHPVRGRRGQVERQQAEVPVAGKALHRQALHAMAVYFRVVET